MKTVIQILVLTTFCVGFALSANVGPVAVGPVTININGKMVKKYALTNEASKHCCVKVNETSITLHGGGRIYLGDSNSGIFSPDSFFLMPLVGKRLTYDVDMSNVGCNCNAALYCLAMPAYNSSQKLEPGPGGDYYCDADKVGGTYCPDMDVMEANKYAMASTAHSCTPVPPHYYSTCDRVGCGTNVLDADYDGYGPGKTIDTNTPFTLAVSFIKGSDGTLSTVQNTFSQGGRVVKFDTCTNASYLQKLGNSLPGVVMTMSLWGTGEGGMSWLDGKSGCHGGCNVGGSKVTFSNIRLEDL